MAQLRMAHGEDQGDIGAVLEVDRSHVAHIERGRNSLTLEKTTIICNHWGISIDEFVGRPQDEPDLILFKSEVLTMPTAAFRLLWEIMRLLKQFWPTPR